MTEPTHIDIIVTRDPDSSTEINVYVDGKAVWDLPGVKFNIVSLDPGAGYDREDWNEQRDYAARSVHPDLVDEVNELYESLGDSPYIYDRRD